MSSCQQQHTRRGRTPRVKLRRRDHCCSPEDLPSWQLWKPSPRTTGAGLGCHRRELPQNITTLELPGAASPHSSYRTVSRFRISQERRPHRPHNAHLFSFSETRPHPGFCREGNVRGFQVRRKVATASSAVHVSPAAQESWYLGLFTLFCTARAHNAGGWEC